VAVPPLSRNRWLAYAVAAAALLLTVAGAAFAVLNRGATVPDGTPTHVAYQLVLAVLYIVAGWVLAARRPNVVFGWLALAAGVRHALSGAGAGWAIYSVTDGRHLAGTGVAILAAFAGEPLESLVWVAILATFPHGRLPTGPIRWFAAGAALLCGVGWLLGLVTPIEPIQGIPAAVNPIGILPVPLPVGLFYGIGLLLGSIVIVVRWLRASGWERQVLRWLAVVNIGAIVLTPVIVVLPIGELVTTIATMIELVVIAAVVLSNQL
jgi:two-component system, NarL family, sensor kinase